MGGILAFRGMRLAQPVEPRDSITNLVGRNRSQNYRIGAWQRLAEGRTGESWESVCRAKSRLTTDGETSSLRPYEPGASAALTSSNSSKNKIHDENDKTRRDGRSVEAGRASSLRPKGLSGGEPQGLGHGTVRLR